ncbi:hypothetical protein T310_10015 [Rasamsonia emersonii CBS 393.64]|uniref:Uncharacterized protein n=1 Tax=Rasamsonia emersonii (strain ATCC 16479 / CBS 393.64 / IMI 116815) TaxID=1408163 RepID=A0A0F4YFL7_RASE3|nr:hypothetical protein T310_10015 [Rasamsonia emersonii CBS 393.64]KKA16408.1 hypothetical protein T310_10015 [Rasamsonia emersonii CBS 393.64]
MTVLSTPLKTYHHCQYKRPVPDVNHSAVLSSSPAKSQSSSSSDSKDSFRLIARQLLDSLQPEPLNVPLRSTENRNPDFVDPSDIISNASQEVPIMLSDEPSPYENTLHGNQYHHEQQALLDTSLSTGMGSSSSYDSSPRFFPRSESEPRFVRKHIPHSKSESHIKNEEAYEVCAYQREHRHVHFDFSEQKNTVDSQPSTPVRGRPLVRPSVSRNHLNYDDDDDIDIFHGSPKKGSRSPHKKLFGENGWLGRTTSMKEQPDERYRKTALQKVGEKIKQQVEDWVTGDMAKAFPKDSRQDNSPPRIVSRPTLPISLDPPTQAKMYSEIEVMICMTANKFLLDQFHKRRMSAESIKKITNFWMSKNRAQVSEFQFDQATQRELILYNLRTFEFHGEYAINPVALKSALDNWKAVAKEMSVRTFCYPDSVIRKHMHDTHKILEMLGASDATLRDFEFLQMKVIVKMSEHRRKNSEGSDGKGSPRAHTGRAR